MGRFRGFTKGISVSQLGSSLFFAQIIIQNTEDMLDWWGGVYHNSAVCSKWVSQTQK